MMNRDAYLSVYQAVYWDLDRVVFGAVVGRGDVGRCGTVYQAVYWGLDRTVYETGAQPEEPPHPGLALYSGSVA